MQNAISPSNNQSSSPTSLDLPFKWDTLPTIPLGIDGHKTRTETEKYVVPLTCGRAVALDSLHQFKTYAGVLCGLPIHPYYNELRISAAMREVRKIHPEAGELIWVVAPRLQRATVITKHSAELERRTGQRQPDQREVDFLPPVCSIGNFRSDAPVHDNKQVYSSLIAIWYQDEFGAPDDYVKEQLKELPWNDYAWDWNY